MGRNRMPATLKQGKSESKEYLEARQLIENELKGAEDLIFEFIPDTLDELGVVYYQFIIKELKETGILANLDIPLLTQMANALAQMDLLQKDIDEHGRLMQKVDRAGNSFPIANPAVNMQMQYQKIFQSISSQFGMSPSARAQIANLNTEVEKERDDELLAILDRRRKRDEDE